ncbi:nucleotidyl transferase [Chitinispirillum alkaliphilum]|nr:nucleotidyl transferase [Chitinispirillum alkaliphilum]
MRGFILCAGFGTRLKPITDHVPKALVPVCGEPLLMRNLRFLRQQGFCDLAVNTHYFHQQIESVASNSHIPFRIFHEADSIRGTGGAFDFAREFLAGDDTFFIMNVDMVNNFNIREMGERFRQSSNICSLVTVPSKNRGTILYDTETLSYIDVVSPEKIYPKGVSRGDFTGCAFYRKEFLELVSAEDFSILPVWKKALELGLGVGVEFPDTDYWIDIGTPKAYAQLHFDYMDRLVSLDIPSGMDCDFEKKICCNRDIGSEILENIGPYSWVEQGKFSDDASVERCVIWPGGEVKGRVSRTIVTPWGNVEF